jgi:endoglycosylceramidase
MYWAYDKSDGYGLLNPDGTEKTVLLDTIVRPYPQRVAGDPVSFAYDAPTSTFTFSYVPDASLQTPTVIAVPDRVYPHGYSVDCGGCTATKTPGVVTLTDVATSPTTTVTIRP